MQRSRPRAMMPILRSSRGVGWGADGSIHGLNSTVSCLPRKTPTPTLIPTPAPPVTEDVGLLHAVGGEDDGASLLGTVNQVPQVPPAAAARAGECRGAGSGWLEKYSSRPCNCRSSFAVPPADGVETGRGLIEEHHLHMHSQAGCEGEQACTLRLHTSRICSRGLPTCGSPSSAIATDRRRFMPPL